MSDIFELFRKTETVREKTSAPEYLVAGLGNPEKKYACNRHNAGFMTIDRMTGKYGITVDRAKFHGLYGTGTISGKRVVLLKPMTYMNSSGIAVRECADYYRIPMEKIIIISDDVSFDVGKMRIRTKGSAGGHNGLKSINEYLGSEGYLRIKMGVGQKPCPEYDMADWVLGDIPEEQRAAFRDCADRAIAALELILQGSTEKAMALYNC